MINKNILTIGALIFTAVSGFSQVRVGSQVEVAIVDQNPFLDLSNYNSYDQDRGRGLYFPRTDLTTFKFITDKLEGIDTFLTAFDGMVVYNTASGQTGPDAQTQGLQVDVEPGFYYFSNPDSKNQGGTSVAEGKWIRIGDKASSSPKAVDYKLGDAKPTGEFFWPDDQEAHKKPVMRKTIEVQFNDVTYTDVTDLVPEDAVFIKTQLVDKATGKLLLASAEFKPNGGAEFSVDPSKDFFVAKYGEMSTTLNGTYTMILEYYVP